jgi:hypothetical protein
MSLDHHVKMVQIKKQDERKRLVNECEQLIMKYDLDEIARDILMNRHHTFSGLPKSDYFTKYEICKILRNELEIAFHHDPNYIFRIYYINGGNSYVYVCKNTFLNRFLSIFP